VKGKGLPLGSGLKSLAFQHHAEVSTCLHELPGWAAYGK